MYTCRLPISLRSPYGFVYLINRTVAGCDHYYRSPQDLTIFKNHIYKPQTTEPSMKMSF